MKHWRKVTAIVWKDLLSEIRTKEVISSVLVFALLAIVTFNFAFAASGQEAMRLLAPGILWVTFAFAGVLSFSRTFIPEKEDGCLEGLMVCPMNREVIYAGKLAASFLLLLIVEIAALLIFAFLFNVNVLSLPLLVTMLLTTVGFAALGTLFSALAVNTRARELVLPILFLPIMVPLIISAVKASGVALSGEPWRGLSSWFQIIGAFDAIFLVVSFLVFTFVIEE